MTTSYNATIEVDIKGADLDEDRIDHLMTMLEPVHGTIGESSRGHLQAIVTFPADNMQQAVLMSTTLALHSIGEEPVAVGVMTTEEFDRRIDWAEVPPLVSVSEAADILGVSRTRVQQRIADKSIQAIKVGDTYAIVKSTLTSRPPGRPTTKPATKEPWPPALEALAETLAGEKGHDWSSLTSGEKDLYRRKARQSLVP